MNHSTVQDLCDANTAVERLKVKPFLGIRLPHISIHEVRRATIQDASWANTAEYHSQGGISGWCNFAGVVGQRPVSFRFSEPQVPQSEKKVPEHVGRRNTDHARSLGRVRMDPWAFRSVNSIVFRHRRVGGQAPESGSPGGRTFVGRRNEAPEGFVDRRRREPV